jgi:hypothetical protein
MLRLQCPRRLPEVERSGTVPSICRASTAPGSSQGMDTGSEAEGKLMASRPDAGPVLIIC